MAGSVETLELHEPEDAFRRIEVWLRERGFFQPGGESLVADLYLGYGLSRTIRRVPGSDPPEPCPLPLAACRLLETGTVGKAGSEPDGEVGSEPDGEAGRRGGGRNARRSTGSAQTTLVAQSHKELQLQLGEWETTWTAGEYASAVERVRAAIARGDVYQVNLVQHLSAPFAGDAASLAGALGHLRPLRPKPFAGDGWTVVSASPELFLARRGRRVWTMPIKGTRELGSEAELRESAKDAAEHLMIVDLERNDLSRVCVAGSVRWPELMATRGLAGVEHMVSTVEGTIRERVGLAELLEATFPGGSVTGAPKIAAVDLIAELEPVGRGASMGALGQVFGNGDLELALTIRTFAAAEGRLHLWVGGGVVWDSDPDAEVEESWTKARPLLDAVAAAAETAVLG